MTSGPGWDPIVPVEAGSILYNPQPIRDRQVGEVGDFHTVRGGISPSDIRVRSRVVGVVYVWMDYNPGMGSYRPHMTFTLCTTPGQ